MRVFDLPDLGEGLTEAEIVEWRVDVGDAVAVDQIVAVVETAKASVELPCPYAGRVAVRHASPGQLLEVGAPFLSVETEASDGAGAQPSELAPQGTAPAAESAAARDHREEERAGSGNVLIGFGTSEGGVRRRRRLGRRDGRDGHDGHDRSGTAEPPPGTDGPPPGAATPEPGSEPAPAAPPPPPGAVAGHDSGGAVRVISPLVRRLAAERALDLRTVAPSGPGGIITRADVERGAPASPPATPAAPPPGTAGASDAAPDRAPGAAPAEVRLPLTGVRRAVAEKLTRSRREIPDATTWVDVDATPLLAARDDIRAALPDAGVGVLALVARICVAGLRRFPELNARVDPEREEIVRLRDVHLSFAADSPRGLVVPVVRDAGSMTTTELAAELRRLTARAREGTLSPAELTGGTFTLNNYGVFGTDGSTPILNHPEAGMLGVGRIADRPWAHEGQIALRRVAQLSLTFDHRVCDGGSAGGFLRFVADCVERPGVLLAGL